MIDVPYTFTTFLLRLLISSHNSERADLTKSLRSLLRMQQHQEQAYKRSFDQAIMERTPPVEVKKGNMSNEKDPKIDQVQNKALTRTKKRSYESKPAEWILFEQYLRAVVLESFCHPSRKKKTSSLLKLPRQAQKRAELDTQEYWMLTMQGRDQCEWKSSGSRAGQKKSMSLDATYDPYALYPPFILTHHAKERLQEEERAQKPRARFAPGTKRTVIATVVPTSSNYKGKRPRCLLSFRRGRVHVKNSGRPRGRHMQKHESKKTLPAAKVKDDEKVCVHKRRMNAKNKIKQHRKSASLQKVNTAVL